MKMIMDANNNDGPKMTIINEGPSIEIAEGSGMAFVAIIKTI